MRKVKMEAIPGEEQPLKTGNIMIDIKMFLNKSYKFRRNIISRNIEVNGDILDDKRLNSIFVQCKTHITKATKDLVASIIFSDYVPDYSPFAEFIEYYINNYPKESTGHIDKFISTISTDTKHYELFIKKWLVSLIASAHGKHSPLFLVLCGGQNTGKTEWFRRLLPESLKKYYAESKLDLGKDDEILMTKKLIIMDDEMGGKSKQEHKKIKEMTSKQIFSIREPYGRISADLQRLAMLCGTTNDEEILNDPTGNRRFLPVRVLDVDKKLYNSINKDLLFFECYLEYDNGYNYELSTDDIDKLRDSGAEFKQSSSEEELLTKYFGRPEDYDGYEVVEKTNSEILAHIKVYSTIQINQTKLGIILRQMGFEQYHKKINKTTIRVYKVIELSQNRVNNEGGVNQAVNRKDAF